MSLIKPSPYSRRPSRGRRVAAWGFTLIELIMVIVILGVLAVFAAPRMFNTGDFYARGFHDETLALLRYAQKTAIAQRRIACVTFTDTSAMLSITSDSPTATACDIALTGPNQNCNDGAPAGSKGCITARSGVTFSPTPDELRFDGLGQPLNNLGAPINASRRIQFFNNSANDIIVEAGTGYVHESP